MGLKKSIYKNFPFLDKGFYLDAKKSYRGINENLEMIIENQKNFEEKLEYLFFLSKQKEGESLIETKKRIFLNMPKAEGKLRLIQLGNNYILKKIKEICNNCKVKFFLMDGTLLGAHRHKGFIPWDDDIDIGMFRKDFEKFKLCINTNNEEIEVKQYYSLTYHFGANKYYKTKIKGNDDFFVDIFVCDDIAVDYECENEQWKYTQQICKEYHFALEKLVKKFYNDSLYIKPKAIPEIDEDENRLFKQMCKRIPYYGEGDMFCQGIDDLQNFREDKKFLFKKEHLPVLEDELEFEGVKYPSLTNYERLLEKIYGDIWTMPRKVKPLHINEFENISEITKILKDKGVI